MHKEKLTIYMKHVVFFLLICLAIPIVGKYIFNINIFKLCIGVFLTFEFFYFLVFFSKE